jgi:hypothetical protein
MLVREDLHRRARYAVIPVLDLGVRPGGARAPRRPLELPAARIELTSSSEPIAVVAALSRSLRSKHHVADLDAILRRVPPRRPDGIRPNSRADLGSTRAPEASDLPAGHTRGEPVIGFESIASIEAFAAMRAAAPAAILARHAASGTSGPRPLRHAAAWPERVIDDARSRRVGGGRRSRRAANARPRAGQAFHAAGGVRDINDLERLEALARTPCRGDRDPRRHVGSHRAARRAGPG